MKILFNLLYLLPKNLISYLVGLFVSISWPAPVGPLVVKWFARRYKINLSEAEKDISAYSSIQQLFTRKLKPGVRQIQPTELVHPTDSELTVSQLVNDGSLIQAKGKSYFLNEFLNNDKACDEFKGGAALTYYLCPTDYHRVHSPCDGLIEAVDYIPGQLWPVNNWSVANINCLFTKNERVVIWLKTNKGRLAYVMVGATNVGKMTLSFDPEIITNQSIFNPKPFRKDYPEGLQTKKGEELGVFNMGSTVVLIYQKSVLDKVFKTPQAVQVGQGVLF